MALIFICRAALILHLSCRSHLHTAGRATLISTLPCRSHHTAVGLRSFYIARVALIFIQQLRLILISIHLSCRSHSHTADVLLSFPLNVWLLLSLSRVAGRIPRVVQGRDVGRSSPT